MFEITQIVIFVTIGYTFWIRRSSFSRNESVSSCLGTVYEIDYTAIENFEARALRNYVSGVCLLIDIGN
jgi:hypothetical protein